MTDVRDNPAPAPLGGSGTAAATAPAADPLHNLYRMSRTAGLGSGEYVAINNTAVAAFLMGLASVLALLSPYLLLFVIAAVILGAMALLQIGSSNGTQTGRAFATVGMLLALVFGGTTGGKMALAAADRRKAEAEVAEVIRQLGERLASREHAQAYGTLFSEKFREGFSEAEFTNRWESVERDAGPVKSVEWGGRAEIEPARGNAPPRAAVRALFRFEKVAEPTPLAVALSQQEGEWVIESLGEFLNVEAERRQRQQSAPKGPAMGPQFQIGP